jgi:hypothetical protein
MAITFQRSTRAAGFFLLMALVCGQSAAQGRGQYLPGLRGLSASEQPPPGFSCQLLFLVSHDTFKNRDGDKAPIDFSLDLLAAGNLFAYTLPKAKVLGGTFTLKNSLSSVWEFHHKKRHESVKKMSEWART